MIYDLHKITVTRGKRSGNAVYWYKLGKFQMWKREVRALHPDMFDGKTILSCLRIYTAVQKEVHALYDEVINAASIATFGKPWTLSMYKVSGIGRDEFPEDTKNRLRDLVKLAQDLQDIRDVYLKILSQTDGFRHIATVQKYQNKA